MAINNVIRSKPRSEGTVGKTAADLLVRYQGSRWVNQCHQLNDS